MLRFIFLSLLAAVLSSTFGAQVSSGLQDLALTQHATGIAHAGDLAVDGQGNVWIVQTQGTIGGTQGSLTKVTPAGVVTPNAIVGLAEIGDLVRASDGNVYFWSNIV